MWPGEINAANFISLTLTGIEFPISRTGGLRSIHSADVLGWVMTWECEVL